MVEGVGVGEVAAMAAAALWAIASIFYARMGQTISPLVLNFTKGCVAIVFLLTTLWLLDRPFPSSELRNLLMLALSGVLGIGLGDTCFFRSLTLLGPRRTLLLESLAPPLSALLALLFLGEVLSRPSLLGIFFTVGGVTWAVSERLAKSAALASAAEAQSDPTAQLLPGIGYGLLAAFGQASGAVLSRSALAETPVDPLWSSFIRLGAGAIFLLPWLIIRWARFSPVPKRLTHKTPFWTAPFWKALPRTVLPQKFSQLLGGVAIAAFLGTYLAIWLQQISLKYALTGVSQALTSTSQLFVLPLVVILGERLSLRAVLGVAIALLGIALLFR